MKAEMETDTTAYETAKRKQREMHDTSYTLPLDELESYSR